MARGKLREKNGHFYMCIVDNSGQETTRSIKKEFGLSKEPSQKQAEKYLAKKLAEMELTGIGYSSKMTVESFLKEWLESKESNISSNSLVYYKGAINNHIVPLIGDMRLDQLNKGNMQKYVTLLSKDCEPPTVMLAIKVLKLALNSAVDWELIMSNPALRLELPKYRKKEKVVWSDKELAQFLDVNRDDDLMPLYKLIIATGLRRGEALALTWDDVNFDGAYIKVSKSLDKTKVIRDTKTTSSIREVIVPDFIIATLRELKVSQSKFMMATGQRNKANYLFVNKLCLPCDPNLILRRFKRSCQKAGVRETDLHSLRHLHVSMLVSAGVDVKTIQKRVGHSDASTTMNIYAHMLNNTDKEAADKIESKLTAMINY